MKDHLAMTIKKDLIGIVEGEKKNYMNFEKTSH